MIDASGNKYPGFGIGQGKTFKVRLALQYAVASGKIKKVRLPACDANDDAPYVVYNAMLFTTQVSGSGLSGTYRLGE